MRRSACLLAARPLLLALLCAPACGDDSPAPTPDAPPVSGLCAPDQRALPTQGPFLDPLAIDLGACVEGSVEQIAGRWFLRDGSRFNFSYPRFEGDCESGFSRLGGSPEDRDESDDTSLFTWTDGTRLYRRAYAKFMTQRGDEYEYASLLAACVLADGTLSVVSGPFETDFGDQTSAKIGTRFEPKDTGGQNIALVGAESTPHSALQVAVDGNYAFTGGPSGLFIYDVSNPAQPTLVAQQQGSFNDVKIAKLAGKTILYGAPYRGDDTIIFDVSDPLQPRAVGSLGAYSHSIFLTQDPPRMYLGDYSETVPVYDIANPTSPTLLGRVPLPRATGMVDPPGDVGVHDIHVVGTRIYADKTQTGVVAVDIANGITNPTTLGGILTSYSHATWAGTAGGRKIAIHGDEGMMPEGGAALMRVIDADETSPTFMQEIGRYASRPQVGIHNMILHEGKAFIAYYQDGIRVVDLADPTAPVETAFYNTFDNTTTVGDAFEGAVGLALKDDLIFVADYNKGLLVLRYTP